MVPHLGAILSQNWFDRFLPEAVLSYFLAGNSNSQTGNTNIYLTSNHLMKKLL
jgi:hypothetical protein